VSYIKNCEARSTERLKKKKEEEEMNQQLLVFSTIYKTTNKSIHSFYECMMKILANIPKHEQPSCA
jgi:hypothetical protein